MVPNMSAIVLIIARESSKVMVRRLHTATSTQELESVEECYEWPSRQLCHSIFCLTKHAPIGHGCSHLFMHKTKLATFHQVALHLTIGHPCSFYPKTQQQRQHGKIINKRYLPPTCVDIYFRTNSDLMAIIKYCGCSHRYASKIVILVYTNTFNVVVSRPVHL